MKVFWEVFGRFWGSFWEVFGRCLGGLGEVFERFLEVKRVSKIRKTYTKPIKNRKTRISRVSLSNVEFPYFPLWGPFKGLGAK